MMKMNFQRLEGKPAVCSAAHRVARVAHFAKLAGPRRNIHRERPTRPQLQVSSDDPPMCYSIQTSQFNLNNLIRSTGPSGVRFLFSADGTLRVPPVTCW